MGMIAFFTSDTSLNNLLGTEKNQVEFVEKFQSTEGWLPGETISKKPYFKNTGDSPLLLRIKPKEMWSKNGSTVDRADTSMVQKNWTDAWNKQWKKGSDGYYYYLKVLKGGGKTDVILSGITLKTSTSNVKTRVDYSDLIYTLDFQAESVVDNEKAIPDSWNVSVTIQGDDVTWTEKGEAQ